MVLTRRTFLALFALLPLPMRCTGWQNPQRAPAGSRWLTLRPGDAGYLVLRDEYGDRVGLHPLHCVHSEMGYVIAWTAMRPGDETVQVRFEVDSASLAYLTATTRTVNARSAT